MKLLEYLIERKVINSEKLWDIGTADIKAEFDKIVTDLANNTLSLDEIQYSLNELAENKEKGTAEVFIQGLLFDAINDIANKQIDEANLTVDLFIFNANDYITKGEFCGFKANEAKDKITSMINEKIEDEKATEELYKKYGLSLDTENPYTAIEETETQNEVIDEINDDDIENPYSDNANPYDAIEETETQNEVIDKINGYDSEIPYNLENKRKEFYEKNNIITEEEKAQMPNEVINELTGDDMENPYNSRYNANSSQMNDVNPSFMDNNIGQSFIDEDNLEGIETIEDAIDNKEPRIPIESEYLEKDDKEIEQEQFPEVDYDLNSALQKVKEDQSLVYDDKEAGIYYETFRNMNAHDLMNEFAKMYTVDATDSLGNKIKVPRWDHEFIIRGTILCNIAFQHYSAGDRRYGGFFLEGGPANRIANFLKKDEIPEDIFKDIIHKPFEAETCLSTIRRALIYKMYDEINDPLKDTTEEKTNDLEPSINNKDSKNIDIIENNEQIDNIENNQIEETTVNNSINQNNKDVSYLNKLSKLDGPAFMNEISQIYKQTYVESDLREDNILVSIEEFITKGMIIANQFHQHDEKNDYGIDILSNIKVFFEEPLIKFLQSFDIQIDVINKLIEEPFVDDSCYDLINEKLIIPVNKKLEERQKGYEAKLQNNKLELPSKKYIENYLDETSKFRYANFIRENINLCGKAFGINSIDIDSMKIPQNEFLIKGIILCNQMYQCSKDGDPGFDIFTRSGSLIFALKDYLNRYGITNNEFFDLMEQPLTHENCYEKITNGFLSRLFEIPDLKHSEVQEEQNNVKEEDNNIIENKDNLTMDSNYNPFENENSQNNDPNYNPFENENSQNNDPNYNPFENENRQYDNPDINFFENENNQINKIEEKESIENNKVDENILKKDDIYEKYKTMKEQDLVDVYDEKAKTKSERAMDELNVYLFGNTKLDPDKMLDSFYKAFNREKHNGIEASDDFSKRNLEIGMSVYKKLTDQYNEHGFFGKLWGYISGSTKKEREALKTIENFFEKKGYSKSNLKSAIKSDKAIKEATQAYIDKKLSEFIVKPNIETKQEKIVNPQNILDTTKLDKQSTLNSTTSVEYKDNEFDETYRDESFINNIDELTEKDLDTTRNK